MWTAGFERRWLGSLRLFARSETTVARRQLARDALVIEYRDCAALSGCCARGPDDQPSQESSQRCWGSRDTVTSSTRGACSSSACTISSMRTALEAVGPARGRPRAEGRLAPRPGGAGLRPGLRRPRATNRSLLATARSPMTEATAAFSAGRGSSSGPAGHVELRPAANRGTSTAGKSSHEISLCRVATHRAVAQAPGQIITTPAARGGCRR